MSTSSPVRRVEPYANQRPEVDQTRPVLRDFPSVRSVMDPSAKS